MPIQTEILAASELKRQTMRINQPFSLNRGSIFSLAGGGLLDRMIERKEIRESQIALFIRQLLQALDHMHSRNVVHLDLKVILI